MLHCLIGQVLIAVLGRIVPTSRPFPLDLRARAPRLKSFHQRPAGASNLFFGGGDNIIRAPSRRFIASDAGPAGATGHPAQPRQTRRTESRLPRRKNHSPRQRPRIISTSARSGSRSSWLPAAVAFGAK